ncbi:MAG TPA: metal ABC transporter permease [Candidatus Acidoferrum sp.]|nr:metal ABC transporter permease [Candidatus Acidoferrum sp.]
MSLKYENEDKQLSYCQIHVEYDINYIIAILFGSLATYSYFAGIIPQWVAAITVILGSIGINKALRSTKIAGDAAVAVFLKLGLAAGVTLVSITGGFGVNLENLLFGSILAVDFQQIIIAGIVTAVSLAIIFLFFKELFYITFDETQARASGIRTWVYDYLLSILAGITVVISIRCGRTFSVCPSCPASVSEYASYKIFQANSSIGTNNWPNHSYIWNNNFSHHKRSSRRNNCSYRPSNSRNRDNRQKNPE